MIGLLLKKEIRVFFSSKSNLIFMTIVPILLISIFSFSLGSYIEGDYGTFKEGKVFFYEANPSTKALDSFFKISKKITVATGVVFEKINDYEVAKKMTESSQAYGVITINSQGYDYYRSPFNESEGASLIRTLFTQLAQGENDSISIKKTVLDVSPLNAKGYYTFSSLAFVLLFMSVLIAYSVSDEKEFGTITRIMLSSAGIYRMLASKIITGLLCGAVQITVAYLFSSFVLGIIWGKYALCIIGILLLLSVTSAVFGAILGMISKTKSMAQSMGLMTTMMCGYLGGSITPLYLLENTLVLNIIIKISPLYWTNRAIMSLHNGILDRTTIYSISVLLGLSIIMSLLYLVKSKKNIKMEVKHS